MKAILRDGLTLAIEGGMNHCKITIGWKDGDGNERSKTATLDRAETQAVIAALKEECPTKS